MAVHYVTLRYFGAKYTRLRLLLQGIMSENVDMFSYRRTSQERGRQASIPLIFEYQRVQY